MTLTLHSPSSFSELFFFSELPYSWQLIVVSIGVCGSDVSLFVLTTAVAIGVMALFEKLLVGLSGMANIRKEKKDTEEELSMLYTSRHPSYGSVTSRRTYL